VSNDMRPMEMPNTYEGARDGYTLVLRSLKDYLKGAIKAIAEIDSKKDKPCSCGKYHDPIERVQAIYAHALVSVNKTTETNMDQLTKDVMGVDASKLRSNDPKVILDVLGETLQNLMGKQMAANEPTNHEENNKPEGQTYS